MDFQNIIELTHGIVLTPGIEMPEEIEGCSAADLMSDVLAYVQPHAVLITGLCNPQVVRTALMLDLAAIIIVRGKRLPKETLDIAEQENMLLVSTPLGMFETCGRLYKAGLHQNMEIQDPDSSG